MSTSVRVDGGRVAPRPRYPNGTGELGRSEYIAHLEQRVDQLEHRNAHLEDRLRAVTALQAVDQAFCNHIVAQRNHAWEDVRLLKVTLEAARAQLATLARPR